MGAHACMADVMRLAAVFLLCTLAACGSSATDAGTTDDAAADAGMTLDAAAPDSGRFAVACGTATCTMDEYCHVDPTGPCNVLDGGTCAAAEETCRLVSGEMGCTTPKARMCRTLPGACAANASCPCLINANLCPNAIAADCVKRPGEGPTVECPPQ
jgi:hypothetical protein